MTTTRRTLSAAVLAVACIAAIFQTHQNSKLREQIRLLQQQRASTLEQAQIMQRERDEATSKLVLLTTERQSASNGSASDKQFRELLRLRGVVGVLRRQLAEANPQAVSDGSALDLVQAGNDILWQDDFLLRVTKRDGDSVEGIRIIVSKTLDGQETTITADTGTLLPGSVENSTDIHSVRITLRNAQFQSATHSGTGETMMLVLRK